MNAAALVGIVIRINEKYAESLGKDIQFRSVIEGEHPDYHVFTVLSILNNLTANAVEAMGDRVRSASRRAGRKEKRLNFRRKMTVPAFRKKSERSFMIPGLRPNTMNSAHLQRASGLLT